MSNGIVIVGGGLAAGTAAETLRDDGFDGPIRIVAAETYRPHERPPLSKGFLTGSDELDAVFVHDESWAREHDVELQLGTVAAEIDTAAQSVTLENGESLAYDSLLIATGAAARRVDVDGGEARGIHYLRTIGDSEAVRDALKVGGKRVVIVGSGWIGLEVAAAARGYGNDVTVVGREKQPLSAALGREMGEVFASLHRENGVTLMTETQFEGFDVARDDGSGAARVASVLTSRGPLPADIVVVGIGAVPNVSLAERAGIAVDNGIVVDEHTRTSVPGVYAAGDVANAFHPFVQQHMRNEHWANAIDGGKVAARSMLGHDAVFDAVPYFFTDQFDLGMEYAGFAPLTKDATVVTRGDVAGREFIAFWINDGRVVAGMNVNMWDVNDDIKALIASRKTVDLSRVRDTNVPLRDV